MSQSHHTSLSLRTQLVTLAKGMQAMDSKDPFSNERLSQQLDGLRAILERDGFKDIAPMASVAARMTELVHEHGELGPDQVHELVTTLVSAVASTLGVQLELKHATTPASQTPSERTQLRMVSSRKLGEILVQMSLLTPQQVEQALSHQRMTGCRLGEALIEMRILSKTAIEGALRVQGVRRASNNDPWRAVS